jgi:hypothetical protein
MHALTKFWHGVWPHQKKEPNPNLQRRITRLFSIKPDSKEFSPTLQVLAIEKNKVRRMTSVYESNLKDFHEDTFVIEKKSFSDRLSLAGFEKSLEEKLNSRFSTPHPVEKKKNEEKDFNAGTQTLTQLLIESDKEFIDGMQNLIDIYVKDFKNLPLFRLKNENEVIETQKRELFGPIEEICDFHIMQFHPMLLSAGDDVETFARNLSMMCNEGHFNCYIVYAMDEEVSWELKGF